MIKAETKSMQEAKSQMDQGKCKHYNSVTSAWKAINIKGRKNSVCSLESRTSGRESCRLSGCGAVHSLCKE